MKLEQLLHSITHGKKYVLLSASGHYANVDLTGDESTEEVLARLQDAWTVLKHIKKHGMPNAI